MNIWEEQRRRQQVGSRRQADRQDRRSLVVDVLAVEGVDVTRNVP